MKKGIFAAMAALMIGTTASAQTVTIYGQDDNVLSTYQKGEVKRIVFNPTGEPGGPDTPDIPDTREAVDLGLSVKWASMNIGAESPYDYGDYFAWGETEPKSDYTYVTAQWSEFSYKELQSKGVIDANGNLTPEYDAATVNWGSRWRMPTKDEIQELLDNCTWTWIAMNGNYGYTVTSKSNGNSIYLPAAGRRDRDIICHATSYGYYWSSTTDSRWNSSYNFYFTSSSRRLFSGDYLYYGRSVRPVTE